MNIPYYTWDYMDYNIYIYTWILNHLLRGMHIQVS